MTTIVTAFYPLRSKYPVQQYLQWAQNFLQLHAPIVLFTEEEFAPIFRAMRPSLPLHIIIRPFHMLEMWVSYEKKWKHHSTLDHETYHSPELYAIWAQKSVFVAETIVKNPFQTTYFYWCDIGVFRDAHTPAEILSTFPNSQHFPPSSILLNSVAPLGAHETAESDFSHVNRIVGGLWGGTAAACLRWRAAYEAQLIQYFSAGRFAGKDQTVMLSAYLTDPSLAVIAKPTTTSRDYWFFQKYLLSGIAPFEIDTSYIRVGPPPPPAVTVNIMGGLGNQFFQVAAAYAHARRHSCRLVLAPQKSAEDGRPLYWDSALQRFQHCIDSVFIKPSWWEPAATEYSAPPPPCSLGLRLQGYFQSPKYFEDFASEIRQLFAPQPAILTTVQERYGDLLAMKDHVVVVHARRGDYLKAAEHHGPLSPAYYSKAMELMQPTDTTLFLLIADEPMWWMEVLEELPALQQHSFRILMEADELVTLALMQHFHRYIISNSTYAWWAAWLADARTVVAPKQWFGPTGPKHWNDIYMPHWVRI